MSNVKLFFIYLFKMIEKLYDICRELSNSKTQVVCIPVGCFDKVSKDDVILMYAVNYHSVNNQSNTTDATRGAGTDNPSGAAVNCRNRTLYNVSL